MLASEFGHPGTTAFAFAWEKVRIENGKKTAVPVVYFEGFYIFMVFGDIVYFFKSETIQFVG